MSKLKKQILNIIFWIALIVGIVMVLWRIFGNSPTDLTVITPFIIMLISKIWSMDNESREFRYQIKSSFNKVRQDMSRIENKLINKRKK